MAAKLACFIFVFNIVACSLATDTTLLSVVQIHRHGERTPGAFYPNDPYQDISYWGISEGQLTNLGKRQLFELGQLTRRRYGEIIPRRYTRETFLAQSTSLDRTFMSAAANLAGLFPPVGDQIWIPNLAWQPIPVFLVNPAIASASNPCGRQTAAWIDALSNNEYYVNLNVKYQPLYEYLTRYTGTTVNSIMSAYQIWDALLIESRQNFTLPRWTRAVYPDPLLEVAIAFFKSFSFTEELKVLAAGPFLNALLEQFDTVIADPSYTQKYLLYSAHDANVASILNALGAYNPPLPPNFASTIYFELRRKKGTNYINIYYKNYGDLDPVTVAGCDFNCKLDDFRRIVSNRTITPDEWNVLCNSGVAPTGFEFNPLLI